MWGWFKKTHPARTNQNCSTNMESLRHIFQLFWWLQRQEGFGLHWIVPSFQSKWCSCSSLQQFCLVEVPIHPTFWRSLFRAPEKEHANRNNRSKFTDARVLPQLHAKICEATCIFEQFLSSLTTNAPSKSFLFPDVKWSLWTTCAGPKIQLRRWGTLQQHRRWIACTTANHSKATASGRNTAWKPAWKYGTKRLEGQSDPRLSWPRCMIQMILKWYNTSQTSDLICAYKSSYIILHKNKLTLSHLHRKTTKISQGLAWENRASITEDSRRSVQRQFETSFPRTVETLDASGIVPSAGPLDSLLALLLQPRRTLWRWTLLDICWGDPGIRKWWWITIRNATPLLINHDKPRCIWNQYESWIDITPSDASNWSERRMGFQRSVPHRCDAFAENSAAQGAEFSSQNCQGDLCDFVAHAHSAHLFQETIGNIWEYTVISGPNMSFSLVLRSFNICALRNLEKSKPPEPNLVRLLQNHWTIMGPPVLRS